MGLIGIWLTLFTGWTVYSIFTSAVRIDFVHEWAIFPLLTIPWFVYLKIQRQYQQHLRSFPHANAAIPELLDALIDENLTARKRAKFMLLALLIFVVVTGLALWQLYAVGKMESRHVLQFIILMAGALGVIVLLNSRRYFRVLKPEGEHLQNLLKNHQGLN
jgi:hypothetical protein